MGLGLLVGQQRAVDAGDDIIYGDGSVGQHLVDFLVATDGKKDVSGVDSGLLLVLGSVSCEFENVSNQVFGYGGHVDGGSSTDSLSVAASLQEAGESSDE